MNSKHRNQKHLKSIDAEKATPMSPPLDTKAELACQLCGNDFSSEKELIEHMKTWTAGTGSWR